MGSEEDRQVRHPWSFHAEDPCEACYKGWQEGDIWKRSDGEGQASQDGRESIPCRSHQAVHLDPDTLFSAVSQVSPFQLLAVGIPRDRNFRVALVQLLKITPCLRNSETVCFHAEAHVHPRQPQHGV